MENSARLAGYSLTLLALACLMGVLANLQDGGLFRRALIEVEFPSVGTLMEDDPVTLKGVEVGRVDGIRRSPRGPVVTLELYKRTPLSADTRFINYNYSLFGARMVVLSPGRSPEPLDPDAVQQGYFVSGVAESIHKVEELLRTVVEYRGLADRLERGGDSALSFRDLLERRIYPALDGFTAFAAQLETLERKASGNLDGVARASADMRRWSGTMAHGTDTLVAQAQATVDRMSRLTAQTVVLLNGMEKVILATQDSSRLTGRLLAQRDLYERTLSLSHALNDLLKDIQKQGLKDIIHFWRNVHFRDRK